MNEGKPENGLHVIRVPFLHKNLIRVKHLKLTDLEISGRDFS